MLNRIAYYERMGGDRRFVGIEAHTEEFCLMQECLADPVEGSKFNDIRMQYATHRAHAEILLLPVNGRGVRNIEDGVLIWEDMDIIERHTEKDNKKAVRRPPGGDHGNKQHAADNESVDGEWNGPRDSPLPLKLSDTVRFVIAPSKYQVDVKIILSCFCLRIGEIAYKVQVKGSKKVMIIRASEFASPRMVQLFHSQAYREQHNMVDETARMRTEVARWRLTY